MTISRWLWCNSRREQGVRVIDAVAVQTKEGHNCTNFLTIYSALYISPVCPSVHKISVQTLHRGGLPCSFTANSDVLTVWLFSAWATAVVCEVLNKWFRGSTGPKHIVVGLDVTSSPLPVCFLSDRGSWWTARCWDIWNEKKGISFSLFFWNTADLIMF